MFVSLKFCILFVMFYVLMNDIVVGFILELFGLKECFRYKVCLFLEFKELFYYVGWVKVFIGKGYFDYLLVV